MPAPQSAPKSRWREKVHRSGEDGRPVCGSARMWAMKAAIAVTTNDAAVTCERCLRMQRLVELGLKAKAPKR
jgi:hypothetical protein